MACIKQEITDRQKKKKNKKSKFNETSHNCTPFSTWLVHKRVVLDRVSKPHWCHHHHHPMRLVPSGFSSFPFGCILVITQGLWTVELSYAEIAWECFIVERFRLGMWVLVICQRHVYFPELNHSPTCWKSWHFLLQIRMVYESRLRLISIAVLDLNNGK